MKMCVIGVGNELREDDGVGLVVIEILRNCLKNVDVYPIGGRLFTIPEIIMNYSEVVVIDALPPENNPGKIKTWRLLEGFHSFPKAYSLHDLDLIWQLQFGFWKGFKGKILLIGIEAHSFAYRRRLSLELKRCLPGIILKITAAVKDSS